MSDCAMSQAEHDHECDDAIAQLYTYLDGELDADVVTRIEQHLQRCSPCLEAYDFESELRKVIVSKCSEETPGDLRLRIMTVLERLEESPGPAS
jgi:anti-sigma factor (TIGR02949 family)